LTEKLQLYLCFVQSIESFRLAKKYFVPSDCNR